MSSTRRHACSSGPPNSFGALAAMVLLAVTLAGGAHAQGFTRAPISTGDAPDPASIQLVVNLVNGTSYCAYTVDNSPVTYATKPSGGAWTEEHTQVGADEVALTTTPFTLGNVVPHLAFVEFVVDGPPHVSGNLMWATRSTAGAWTYEVVDPSSDGHCRSPSIALNSSGVPVIAYIVNYSSIGSQHIRLARRLGPNNWQIEELETTSGSFDDVTVRVWNGPEILTYGRQQLFANHEFIYAYKSGSNWVQEEIEPTASNPQDGAMAMPVNGIAHVAYWTNDGMLNYAYRAGANNWVRTKLRPALSPYQGRTISIALGSGNRPSIAYYSEDGDSLRYASLNSSGFWNYQQVAEAGAEQGGVSIGVHSATQTRPKIAHMLHDDTGARKYYLAEGISSFSGNSSSVPAREEGMAVPVATGISIVGSTVMAGGKVALTLGQAEGDDVELELVDVAGRSVARRAPEWLAAGRHELVWDLGSPPSGMYLIHMKTRSGVRAAAKIIVAR